jgi:C-terminal processing protease CtpA/Prc
VVRLLVFREEGTVQNQEPNELEGAAQQLQGNLSLESSTCHYQQHHNLLHQNNQSKNSSKEINLVQSSPLTGNDISSDQSKQVPNSQAFLGNKTSSTSLKKSPNVFLPEDSLDIFVVDLNKKSGKGLGISLTSFVNENQLGVFVSQVMSGGIADSEGTLCAGDHILEVNEKDVRKSSLHATALILKVSQSLVSFSWLVDLYT